MSSGTAAHRALQAVLEHRALDAELMESAMDSILAGEAPPAVIAGLAIALRMRGETTDELAAAARAMRRRASPAPLAQGGGPLLDTCGTGGDGAGTFNVSTACAIVVAAAGARVAKHGNRAVSSRAGSADVLEALGVRVDASTDLLARQLAELGIAFLLAPAFHAALRHAAVPRRELGVRTFFNLLGPLANPAGATHQLVGVFDRSRARAVAEVLGKLGCQGAWVVHGHGGLDEISPSGPTAVAVLRGGEVTETEIDPSSFGLPSSPLEDLRGGDAAENAQLIRRVLEGERGGRRNAVVMNAAAALAIAGERDRSLAMGDLRAARERAEEAIDSGRALTLLERWAAF